MSEEAPIVLLWCDDLDFHAAHRGRTQTFVEGKGDVRTLDKDPTPRAIDQFKHALKAASVVATVERQQLEIFPGAKCRVFAFVPGGNKVFAQKRDRIDIIEAKHHVMPRRVMFAEVDASDVSRAPVDDD